MFRKINIDLGDNFSITAVKEVSDIAIEVQNNQSLIGKARLITDNVDVSCITTFYIEDEYVNRKFNGKYTLGEIVLKFLMKFPIVVRKPEFIFILDASENLKNIVSQRHFDRGDDSNVKNEILIRKNNIIPENRKAPDNIIFKQSINDENLPKLLALLRSNAYWQLHLTLDRLKILITNSRCFFAFSASGEVIGFSRVLTNNSSFASLWDVVVDERYRGKGIGIALMFKVFTDETLNKIENWILYTDTAKGLYTKFGFVPEAEIPNRKLVHKLRLQESHPTYMSELIRSVPNDLAIHLNSEQTFKFLFGQQGKRSNLSNFWNTISKNKQLVRLYLNHLKLPEQSPSLEYLIKLQKYHIETIPHENIDGIYNIHSAFDIPYLLNKFIVENRGGMCFELNYSFAWLLHQLGFKVEIILANVLAYDYAKENNKYPTHPIIIVHFNDVKFLTDVGWSDSYKNPLALTFEEYSDNTGTYRVTNTVEDKLVMQKLLRNQESTNDYTWYDQFVFSKPHGSLNDFTYPKGFLASHTYTHVGNGYLFANLFHFTRVSTNGHSTIWGNRLLTKDNTTKTNKILTKDISVVLRDDFKIAPEIAKKCVKRPRSASLLFSYKPVKEEEFIERVGQPRSNKTAPF